MLHRGSLQPNQSMIDYHFLGKLHYQIQIGRFLGTHFDLNSVATGWPETLEYWTLTFHLGQRSWFITIPHQHQSLSVIVASLNTDCCSLSISISCSESYLSYLPVLLPTHPTYARNVYISTREKTKQNKTIGAPEVCLRSAGYEKATKSGSLDHSG